MDRSDEIVKLVRNVAELPRDDQNRLLRLVDLMSLAPLSLQQESRELLRALIDTDPKTKRECAAGIDELIEHLERAVDGKEDRARTWDALHTPLMRWTVQ